MQQLRSESYGEDIGQHSWVTANELRQDILQLELSSESRLLDLGCGPGGPLAYISGLVGCRCIGVDSNTHAIAAGHARAASLELERLVSLQQLDLKILSRLWKAHLTL
jgi:cyclopropane fatty-acyl-phospholipid synthase-like methyltransferase